MGATAANISATTITIQVAAINNLAITKVTNFTIHLIIISEASSTLPVTTIAIIVFNLLRAWMINITLIYIQTKEPAMIAAKTIFV